MRVIITGGTGLIGTALSQRLVADGYEVIVLSRNPVGRSVPKGVRAEKWDAETAVGWGSLADGAHAIVNLAGENLAGSGLLPDRWTDTRKQRIVQSRLNAGKAVVEAVQAAAQKPRVVIQSSGVDYYGDVPDKVVTETSPPGKDGFLANLTIDWEASTAAVSDMGVRRPVIRTGVVLSDEGGPLATMVLPFKLHVGGHLGSGKQWLSWIHIQDAVRGIKFLLENETADGPYNLCAPDPVQNSEFSRIIGEVMGRKSYLPAPAFALRLALGEVADVVLTGRRAQPERLLEAGFTFDYPDPRSALQDLLN